MPAQLGSSVVLDYGPQGSQQLGSAIVLELILPPATALRLAASMRAPWGGAAPLARALRASEVLAVQAEVGARGLWGLGETQARRHETPWTVATPSDSESAMPWLRYGGRAEPSPRSVWGVSRAEDLGVRAPWGRYGMRAEPRHDSRWGVSRSSDRAASTAWEAFAAHLRTVMRAPSPGSISADATRWVPWVRFSRSLSGGVVVVVPPGNPNEPLFVIPVLREYFVNNQLILRRVDNDTVLPATNVVASLDVDSWTWTFSASMPASALAAIQRVSPDDPLELETVINGQAIRVWLEGVSRERSFASATLNLSGRGISAELGSPHAPQLAFFNDAALTAQQLAAQVLTLNGVPLDWTLDWQMTDWLVPAGVWAKQGTYMDALVEIATAAGGYVQPHPSQRVLKFLKRYPVLPWDWAAGPFDYELPVDAVTVEGIEWLSRPKYNRVFVAGMEGGVQVQATRTATAGDAEAPMVADGLITHLDAGRGRAEAILSDTGNQALVRLRTPVFPDVGLILPGSLVNYVDGGESRVGLARAIQVEGGRLASWQTIEVETHDA
jgi:hypothetical protein